MATTTTTFISIFYFRTEGFYKLHPREKMRTKYHFHRPGVDAFNTGKLGDVNQQKPQVYTYFFTRGV